jgi:hypothetical protein
MKKTSLFLVVAFATMVSLYAQDAAELLVGTWRYTHDNGYTLYTFNANGTGTMRVLNTHTAYPQDYTAPIKAWSITQRGRVLAFTSQDKDGNEFDLRYEFQMDAKVIVCLDIGGRATKWFKE